MKSIYLFSIFIVVAIAQLYIPTSMILQQENVIDSGVAYKFRTRPLDPSDPFKGKYIRLNYDITSVPTTDSTWTGYDDIYVALDTDCLGFAKVKTISREVPVKSDYIKTKVDWYNYYDREVQFSLPFNEFYMNESKAYDAEIAHAEAQTDSLANTTYALVYVLNGNAVLDNVFINDIPIAHYVDKQEE